MSLARRSITSISWNLAANAAAIGILAVRMVLLTRWLTPEIFGVYALADAIIILSGILPNFGMEEAFIHRAPETENENDAAAVHFTLRLLFTAAWAALVVLGAYLFAEGDLQLALYVLTPIYLFMLMTQTPGLILRRRVVHQRLAVIHFSQAVLSSVVALVLAWNGAGLWALLAMDMVTLVIRVTVLYIWRPVWKPRLLWDAMMVRYYVNFGSRAFLAQALATAVDRVDDLWTGFYLGDAALGIYSRAYAFATYPRKLIASPLTSVAGGMYAELKNDRRSLSSAFFRNNALLIRAGFLMTGLLTLLAPELILLLGDQWQDMLTPFRLMLVFVLLDPIMVTIGQLFVSVGQPQKLARARALQLIVLIVGLATLGTTLGINGVALAVNFMLLFGLTLLMWQARRYVDYSLVRLFAVPLLALVLAMGSTALIFRSVQDPALWLAFLLKMFIFSAVYLAVWLVLERQDAWRMFHSVRSLLSS